MPLCRSPGGAPRPRPPFASRRATPAHLSAARPIPLSRRRAAQERQTARARFAAACGAHARTAQALLMQSPVLNTALTP